MKKLLLRAEKLGLRHIRDTAIKVAMIADTLSFMAEFTLWSLDAMEREDSTPLREDLQFTNFLLGCMDRQTMQLKRLGQYDKIAARVEALRSEMVEIQREHSN